jgi:hypothetical protein
MKLNDKTSNSRCFPTPDSPTTKCKFIEVINYNKFMIINKSPSITPVSSYDDLQKTIYAMNVKPSMSLNDPVHSQR